jgi:hypothetical protein
VKLAEFNTLCDLEWARETRGDVIGLSLTNSSYTELARETNPFERMPSAAPIVNPVTRSVVKVAGGASFDTAEVNYGAWAPEPVKTVPLRVTAVPVVEQAAQKARALHALATLAAAQRQNADDLRCAVQAARDARAPWREIAEAVGIPHETVFRQFKAGSPIVVMGGYHARPGQSAAG